MAITRAQQARQLYRDAGNVEKAYGKATQGATTAPALDAQRSINIMSGNNENLNKDLNKIADAVGSVNDLKRYKTLIEGGGFKSLIPDPVTMGGMLLINKIIKSRRNQNVPTLTDEDDDTLNYADGGRIGLNMGGAQFAAASKGMSISPGTRVDSSGQFSGKDGPSQLSTRDGPKGSPVFDDLNKIAQIQEEKKLDAFIKRIELENAMKEEDEDQAVTTGGSLVDTIRNVPKLKTRIGAIDAAINSADLGLANGGRAGLAEGGMPYEGGIMDLDSARQMYGLGKLVKKITKSVKKVAKSPIGKAALLYAGGAYLGGSTALGGAGGSFMSRIANPSNLMNLKNVGNFFKPSTQTIRSMVPGLSDPRVYQRAVASPFSRLVSNITSNIPGGITGAITGASALAGLLTPEQEEEAQTIADETGIDIAEIRANPDKYLARRFRAEGGSMDEPVAKKTMPLLDMDGQEMDLRAEGGFVPIGRMEKADDVPARLSKNEFVFTAEAVRNAGEGDVDKGAEVMYNMMKNLESGGEVSEESQGLDGAREMFQTSQRLEEVI